MWSRLRDLAVGSSSWWKFDMIGAGVGSVEPEYKDALKKHSIGNSETTIVLNGCAQPLLNVQEYLKYPQGQSCQATYLGFPFEL